jgi:IclR family pca regulon transcriptional regulator
MRVKRVESLVKGLEILQAFARKPGGLRLPEVTAITGLPKATAYRFLQTLVDQQYVHYFPDAGVFRLGPRVMSLGFATLSGLDVAELARPHLEELSRRLGQNVNLGVLDGTDVVYLIRVQVRTIFNINLTVGSRVPAHSSALGRVLLAHLDAAPLRAVIARIARDPAAARAIGRGGRTLGKQLRAVREKGYALTDGAFAPGLASVAVPVFRADGSVEEAINVPVFVQQCSVK